METLKRGDLWLANLNPTKGTQPGKVRPVVILQNDSLNEIHDSTIVAPLTSQLSAGVEILRVYVKKSKTTGLEKDSDVLIDQPIAIDNKRFLERLGKLSASDLKIISGNMKVVMDLD
jgi:mRNA interferase MazF